MSERRKLILSVLVPFLLISSVFVLPSYGHFFGKSYRAEISLQGTITLINLGASKSINVNTSTLANVPDLIQPGSYNALSFEGIAKVYDNSITVSGSVNLNGFPLWIEFRTENAENLTGGRYQATGTLDFEIKELPKEVPGIYVYPLLLILREK